MMSSVQGSDEATNTSNDGRQDGCLALAFQGSLTIDRISSLWASSMRQLEKTRPRRLIVDLGSVSSVDGAGLGFLAAMRRSVASWGGEISFRGLKSELNPLISMAELSDPSARILLAPGRPPWVSIFGLGVERLIQQIRDQVIFTGELLSAFTWAIRNPRLIRLQDLWIAADKAGINALPIIILMGFLIGIIIAFLAESVLEPFGAISMIPTILSTGMVREFAPLMTAVFLAGRAGSFFAAEIGTMKITEELDALGTFGLDRMRFLVIPRVLATVVTMPMLTVFFILSGFVGGYAVCRIFDISLPFFIKEIQANVDYIDLLGSLAKSVVFAWIISSIGCFCGFQTGRGPGAVGVSTTRSLVMGIAMIVFADVVIGAVYYFLGI